MQAIFDPVQGFFNAILFVFLSESDRQNIYYLFWTLPINSLMGRETQPLPRASSPGHSSPSFSSKTKKKFSFFHRFTSLFSSSSSFSTSLLPPDTPHGRERAPQSSSHRSDGYSSHYYRDGANDSENDHVGLSRISESGTTMRDSEVYVNSQHRIRDASFVYENDSVSEYSVN